MTRKNLAPLLALPLLLSSCGNDGGLDSAIIILIDTCRYDEIGMVTPQGAVTPFLDRFAESATVFSRATAQSPWTLPSTATLLTSLYPTVHGAVGHYPYFAKIRTGVETGPELLNRAGLATAAFVNSAFLDPVLGLDRGFDTYDYVPASKIDLRTAKETFRVAEDWLEQNESRPFFLLVHLFDPHMAYDPPEPFCSRFLRDYRGDLEPPFGDLRRWREEMPDPDRRIFARALYHAEVAAVDQACGEFLEWFGKRRISKRTVMVVTSDHGEEFWDHGQFEHGHTLYEELIHVPLLIRAPGRGWPETITKRVGLIDVMPTIFGLLGVDIPGSFHGESLVPLMDGGVSRKAYAEALLYGYEWKAVLDDRYEFMYQSHGDRRLLFDLDADSLERNSIAADDPARVGRMAESLSEWFTNNVKRAGGEPQGGEIVDMDEEVIRKLRALGYVD